MADLWEEFDRIHAKKPAAASGDALWAEFDQQPALGDYDYEAVERATAAGLAGDSAPINTEPTLPVYAGVPTAPDGTPDYSGAFADRGDVGAMGLRALVGRVPQLLSNLVELPANANEAVVRALGMEPDDTSLFGSMRGTLRDVAGAIDQLGYASEMDAVDYGLPAVQGRQALDALSGAGDAGLLDRAGTLGRFVGEQTLASAPDMVTAAASLPAYIGSRTNEIAETRVANDGREEMGLGDLAIAGLAATIEGTLERYTTQRLLPGASTVASKGVSAALGRVAKETAVQAPLGGAEEVAAYLGETAGTEKGANAADALDTFVLGALAEGGMGAAVQGAKEVVRPLTAAKPADPVDQAPSAAVEPTQVATEAELEALLVRNAPATEPVANVPPTEAPPVQPEAAPPMEPAAPPAQAAEELSEADLTPEERVAFERATAARADQTADQALVEQMATDSARVGEEDADRLGLREAVTRTVGASGVQVQFLRDADGLPADVRDRVPAQGPGQRTAGLYVPGAEPRVYVFTNTATTPRQAAFTAAHEIAGHHGLRRLTSAHPDVKVGARTAGEALNHTLERALQNPTVAAIADSMTRQRQSGDRLLMAEEALADLAGALRTNDWRRIEEKHGIRVPHAQRSTVRGAVERVVQRVKQIVDAMYGRDVFSDGEVRQLLENAWQAAQGSGAPTDGAALASVDYTPPQITALRKAGLRVEQRTRLERMRDHVKEEWGKAREALRDTDALKQATVDRFHGLRAAEQRAGVNDPERSAYVAARMSAGLASQMESLLTFGAPKWEGGVLGIQEGTVGLLDALKPVEGMVDEWLGWMVGRRAQVLKRQGREHNLSDDDIQALMSLATGREQAFQQAAREYLKIKNAVLDVAEQAGLIDPAARAVWDHAEYIPFYREENDSTIGPGTRRGLSGQTSGIRTLKGGDSNLADPLSNIVRNFTKLLDAAGKNRAVLLAVDELGSSYFTKAKHQFQPATVPLDQVRQHLLEQGVPEAMVDGLPRQTLDGVARMLTVVPPTGDDVVRVMRNGKAEYYNVLDPLVLRALTAFKQPNKGWAIKPFIFFKRLLTTGVTTTMDFVAANFLRDSGSAWVLSDDRFRPGWDSISGVIKTFREDKAARELMMAGGTFMGGHYYAGDPDAAAAALRRALRSKGLSNREIEGFTGTVARSPLQVWDAWIKISSSIENANRRAVYDAALKAGRSRTEAAYLARDLMDFSLQGDAAWIQMFGDMLPFFNARLQGLYKLGRRAGTAEGRKAIALRGGVIALASIGLMAWNMAMYGDAYDELEEWDKDAYWHFSPGTPSHLRIPKPFELGIAFATVPERIMAAIQYAATDGEKGDSPEASFNAAWRAITSTLAINPIPQAVLPIVESWANRKFFTGRAIENMGDEQLLPEAREEWYSSDTMKLLADAEGNATGLSAKRLEHLWSGYTGGLGAYVLDAADWAVRQGTDAPERPEAALRDFPLVGRFARGANPPASTRYVTEFYELLAQGEQAEQTIKEYFARDAKEDRAGWGDQTERALEIQRENKWLLGDVYYTKRAKAGMGYRGMQYLRKQRKRMADLRQEADDVAQSTKLSPQEKRKRLDAVSAQRNQIAREAVRRLHVLRRVNGESKKT